MPVSVQHVAVQNNQNQRHWNPIQVQRQVVEYCVDGNTHQNEHGQCCVFVEEQRQARNDFNKSHK